MALLSSFVFGSSFFVHHVQVFSSNQSENLLHTATTEMGDVGETPLLDMVVRRISEEVADVLKVDRRNVEQHLGISFTAAVTRYLSTTLLCRRMPLRRSNQDGRRRRAGSRRRF